MKKLTMIAALALSGSLALGEGAQSPIDKLISAVPQEKVTEFAALFKETGAKYAKDYMAFLEAFGTSTDKVELVKQYLPKLEGAYEAARAEAVPQEKLPQKVLLLTELKGLITTLKTAVASSPDKSIDKLVAAIPQEKITEFAALFKETGAKYSADYKAFADACKTAPDKTELVKQYLPKFEKAYEAAKAETVPQEKLAQKVLLLSEIRGFIAALRKLAGPTASTGD